MLEFVVFETTMFGPGDDEERTRKDLCWQLESLAQRNESYLESHPGTPYLYSPESEVRYAVPAQSDPDSVPELAAMRAALDPAKLRDPAIAAGVARVEQMVGGERFRDIPTVLFKKFVDCDNLSAYRVAELRRAGIPASPYVTATKRPDGGTTMHAILIWPQSHGGGSEDPSRILGMGGNSPEAVAARCEEHRKNAERREMGAKKIAAAYKAGRLSDDEARAALEKLVALLPPRTRGLRQAEAPAADRALLGSMLKRLAA